MMTRARTLLRLLLVVGALACSASCTLVTDAGKYQQFSNDLTLELVAMSPHIDKAIQVRVIDDAGALHARAVLDGLPAANYDFVMPGILDKIGYHIDFFVDVDENGLQKPKEPQEGGFFWPEHAWRLDPIPPDGRVLFSHNTNFTSVDPPPGASPSGPVRMRFDGFDPVASHIAEAHVIDVEQERIVLVYRFETIERQDTSRAPATDITVPRTVDEGATYRVDFWVDANGDGVYQPPPADEGYRVEGLVADPSDGITARFDRTEPGTVDVDF